eukprot:scaffold18296_cov124-Isochrysis_galbana.AAC.4
MPRRQPPPRRETNRPPATRRGELSLPLQKCARAGAEPPVAQPRGSCGAGRRAGWSRRRKARRHEWQRARRPALRRASRSLARRHARCSAGPLSAAWPGDAGGAGAVQCAGAPVVREGPLTGLFRRVRARCGELSSACMAAVARPSSPNSTSRGRGSVTGGSERKRLSASSASQSTTSSAGCRCVTVPIFAANGALSRSARSPSMRSSSCRSDARAASPALLPSRQLSTA